MIGNGISPYKWWKLLALLLPAVLLAGCAGSGGEETGETQSSVQTGDSQDETLSFTDELVKQTDFEAHDVEGNTVQVSLDMFKESKLTMINVWATYCNPCLREMPELGELAQAYDTEDFRIIGIISDVPENADQEAIDMAKELIGMTGASYTHLLINESMYHALLEDVSAVPTTFFFDENGTLLDTVVGAMDKASWEDKINEYLGEE